MKNLLNIIKANSFFVYITLFTLCSQLIVAQTFQDNLKGEEQGEFPSKWDLIQGSAEVASLNGGSIIYLANKSIITPLINSKNYLSNNFTLEFDAFYDGARKINFHQYYEIRFWEGHSYIKLSDSRGFLNPLYAYVNGANIAGRVNGSKVKYDGYRESMKEHKKSIWRHITIKYNNGALKVFIDDILLVNIPQVEFNPTMISIGVFTHGYADFVRAIKNVSLFGAKGTIQDNDNEDIATDDPATDDPDTQEQISAITLGEGGLLSSSPSSIVPASSVMSPEIIDNIIVKEMIRQNLPGLAIGVYKKGLIDYTKGYGFIDLDHKIPITENTIMRWASISKTITAVAALRLDEKSANFSIEDKVVTHYPHWTSKFTLKDKTARDVKDKSNKNSITIRNLINNRSGINHYTKGLKKENGEYPNSWMKYDSDIQNFIANSAVDIFRDARLDFKPDSTYLYSSYGFNLLGAVIDKNYFDGYPKFVKKNIKDVLGMSSLKISFNKHYKGFQKEKDGIINEKEIGSKVYTLPAGGWESNIKDLLKFAKGILDEKLLKNMSDLWKIDVHINNKGDSIRQTYKRGVFSSGSEESLEVWHGGNHANLTTQLYLIKNSDVAIVLMIPMQSADRTNIVNRIVDKMGTSKSFKTSPRYKCNKAMKNSDKKFIGVWRKTNEDVIIRRGLKTAHFNKEWQFLSSNGYHLEDIEAFKNDEGSLVWDGIFKKGTGQYAMWRNFDQTGFHDKWAEMNGMGYRLYDIETYVINNKRLWAGLFRKQTGKAALRRNLSTSEFGNVQEAYANQGLKLIDIEVFSDSGGQKWTGVWVAGTDGLLNRDYEYIAFRVLNSIRRENGYKLKDVESYVKNGTRKWAGIWEKSTQKGGISRPSNYCDFMTAHDMNSNNGFELIDLERY